MSENSAGINIDGFNSAVRDWTKGARRELVQSMISLDIKVTGGLRKTLKYALKKSDGTIGSISFKFPRYGVFVQKGVGKGVSIEQAGTAATKRVPKDWFNDPIGKQLQSLSDKIQPYYSDAIVNAARVLIK